VGSAQAGTLSQTTGPVSVIGKVRARPTHTPEVSRFVLVAAREAMLGCCLAFFKRYYKDGEIRPVRMNVDDFVRHPFGQNELSI
jgi:hypothetical protein